VIDRKNSVFIQVFFEAFSPIQNMLIYYLIYLWNFYWV